jgi:hypothetical protein
LAPDQERRCAARRALPPLPGWGAAIRIVEKMESPKYTARVDNIYFLSRIGSSLRWATQDIARENLSADIKRLLARLDRVEARDRAMTRAHNDPS